MGVCFQQGQLLGRGDLDIFLTNASGNPTNAYAITYAVYCVDPATQVEVLIGSPERVPVNPQVGEYYSALQIPPNAATGDYRIRWTVVEFAGAPAQTVVQEFCVKGLAGSDAAQGELSACVQDMVNKLRFMMRDNNPDRNYRFRPPQGEGDIGCYNQVFGYIWEDKELVEFLEISLWKWNMHPPETEYLQDLNTLCSKKPVWRAAILWGALVNAAQALAYNWIVDEFSVSPDTLVSVQLPDGRDVTLPIEELHAICTEST